MSMLLMGISSAGSGGWCEAHGDIGRRGSHLCRTLVDTPGSRASRTGAPCPGHRGPGSNRDSPPRARMGPVLETRRAMTLLGRRGECEALDGVLADALAVLA